MTTRKAGEWVDPDRNGADGGRRPATRRIGDAPGGGTMPCRHAEHSPPKGMVMEPGRYEHVCPGCHRRIEFTVWPRPVAWSGMHGAARHTASAALTAGAGAAAC